MPVPAKSGGAPGRPATPAARFCSISVMRCAIRARGFGLVLGAPQLGGRDELHRLVIFRVCRTEFIRARISLRLGMDRSLLREALEERRVEASP